MPEEDLRRLRVLIVDDNSASREILQDIFISWAMHVDLVASGEEALAALETAASDGAPYDLVLLDLKMPGMDGIETVKAMHAISGLAKMPQVFIISAYAQAHMEAEAGDVSAFLLKPVDPAALLETITARFRPAGPDVPAHAALADVVPSVAPHLRGSRILLAEDNEINRELAVELLTDAGLVVDVAENGRIACARVLGSGARYDAVLMDVQMPEMDGLEATVRIREQWPADRLPIIAMTAHAYEAERQRCFDVGMDDHVTKPIEPASLIRTLNHWLKPRSVMANAEPASPVPAIAKLQADELPPTLPPFDLNAALMRMNGKQSLLRKLIINFGDTFGTTILSLREKITTASLDDARRLAHTLKGVAGTLELREVAEAASQTEDALAAGNLADIDRLLDRLEQALRPALAASTLLKGAAVSVVAGVTTTVGHADLMSLIMEFRELLQRRSLRARKAFDLLEQRLGIVPEAEGLHSVKAALARLDFDEALIMLDKVTTRNEITGARNHSVEVS